MRALPMLLAPSLAVASCSFAACAPALSPPPDASDPGPFASAAVATSASAPSAAVSASASASAPPALAPPEMPAQTGAPDGEKIAGIVAVFADAELYTAPKAEADRLSLAKYAGDAPRRAHPRGIVPLIVKRDHGAFIEVGLSPRVDELNVDMGCGDLALDLLGNPGDLAVDVGLFVRRADLAAMIVKPFAKRWDDGSSVELLPGALVAPAEGGFVAELGGFTRRFEGDASLGHAIAALPKETEGEPSKVALARFDGLVLGGSQLPTPRWTLAPTAVAAETRGDRRLFPLRGRCARVVLSVPEHAVRPFEKEVSGAGVGTGLGLGGLGGMYGVDTWVMPKGTSLACSLGGVRAKLKADRLIGGERKDVCAALGLAVTSRYLFADMPETKDASFSCCAKASSAVLRKAKATPGGLQGLGGLGETHGASR